MESRKNKRLFNIIMVAVIIVLAAAAAVAVGSVKGWFADEEGAYGKAQEVSGIVSVERGGASLELSSGDMLMAGDKITTNDKAEILISAGSNAYRLAENSALVLAEDASGPFSLALLQGEMFAVTDEGNDFGSLSAQEKEFVLAKAPAVFTVNVRTGSMSVNVLAGSVALSDGSLTAEAGQALSIVEGEASLLTLSAGSLSSFELENTLAAAESRELCFSTAELDQILAEREQEQLLAAEESANGAESGSEEDNGETAGDGKNDASSGQSGQQSSGQSSSGQSSSGQSSSGQDADEPGQTGQGGSGQSGQQSGQTGGDGGQNEPGNTGGSASGGSAAGTKYDYSCTIEIRCDTILDNMGDLTAGKEGYVPKDGAILKRTTVGFNEGETVYDVLKRVCSARGIHLEASWSPAYGSSYIEGIGHLYEFDCGPQSGWTYKVNGWFPNYGCSAYELEDGDAISWLYTCQGLGADVGGSLNG